MFPFAWMVWITVGRMLFPAPGQSGPWLSEMLVIVASVVVLLPLLVVICRLILSRPSVRESGRVSAVDSLMLSALYLSMLLFAASLHSTDDSREWPSIATRLFGRAFVRASDLIELWSSLAILGLAVAGSVVAGFEWLAERRTQPTRQQAPTS